MKTPRELRSSLERLENRIAPANLTATVVDHVLKIIGTNDSDSLTIDGVIGDPTAFTLTATGSTINGSPGAFTSPTGVTGITIKMLDGDDRVEFSNSIVPIDLEGNLKVDGGVGTNEVVTRDLTVEKNIAITFGLHDSGYSNVAFYNPNVKGSVTIVNAGGSSATNLLRTSAGLSTIGGNLIIQTGSGTDLTRVSDVNIGHNLIVKHGHAAETGDAGFTEIYNSYNTAARSVIGGNVVISYRDGTGNAWDGIWDTAVLGNVTIDHGAGNFTTHFDGSATSLPVIIRGNLTMKGSGANTISFGVQYNHTGLTVGKNLSISSGSGMDTLTFNKLDVGGATRLLLGDGGSTVTIDDSIFAGTFKLFTGSGTDILNLETTAASSSATLFEKAVLVRQGSGNDRLLDASPDDTNEFLIVESTFVLHHGEGPGDVRVSNASHELFPFHNSIQWIT